MAIGFEAIKNYIQNKYGNTTSTSTSTTGASTPNASDTQVKRKNVLSRFWDKLVSIITRGVLNIRSIDTKTKSKIKDAKTKTLTKK